ISRDGAGSRARVPDSAAGSLLKPTVASGRAATARTAAAVARLKRSIGLSSSLIPPIWGAPATPPWSGQIGLDAGLRQLGPEAALIVLGHRRALDLVALVEEGQAEGEADIAEDLGVLGP